MNVLIRLAASGVLLATMPAAAFAQAPPPDASSSASPKPDALKSDAPTPGSSKPGSPTPGSPTPGSPTPDEPKSDSTAKDASSPATPSNTSPAPQVASPPAPQTATPGMGQPGPVIPGSPDLSVATVKMEGGLRSSKVVGAAVFNSGNQQVGTVDDLILDHDDKAVLGVISVGGFLGVGGKLVAVPYSALHVDPTGKVTLPDASKDSLNKMPGFTYAQ